MKKYFPALDGLRLLASVNIVLLHLDSSWLLTYVRDWHWFYPVIKLPLFGASIFFILAGFIYSVKFADPARVPPTLAFLKARFRRLYPLHFICTLLVLAYVGFKTPLFQDPALVVRSVLLHLSMLWAFLPQWGHSLNQPAWALTAFMISYAVAPAFARYLNRGHSLRKLGGLLVLALLPGVLWGTIFSFLEYSDARYLFFHIAPPVRMCEFLFGMILSRVCLQGGLAAPRRAWVNDVAIGSVLVMLYANLYFHKTPFPWMNWFSHHTVNTVLYAVLLLLLAQPQGLVVRMLAWNPIRMLGKSSFYPYLWHMPLIGATYVLCDGLHLPWSPNHWVGTLVLLVVLYGGSTWYSERKRFRENLRDASGN